MNYLLSYPRSGQHLLKHMLKILGLNIYISHEVQLHKEWPMKPDDLLILLVRDFKECLPSHNYRSNSTTVDRRLIDNMFGTRFPKPYRAMQYVENLVLFDVAQCKKVIIHYEDMLSKKTDSLQEAFFNLNGIQGIIKSRAIDWDKEAKICLENYNGVKLSDGKLKHHVERVTEPAYLTQLIKSMNPYIYDKYLLRYEK